MVVCQEYRQSSIDIDSRHEREWTVLRFALFVRKELMSIRVGALDPKIGVMNYDILKIEYNKNTRGEPFPLSRFSTARYSYLISTMVILSQAAG